MSNTVQTARPPRVLFLGMQGNFSYPPLRALLDAGIEVCAVVIPAAPGPMQDQPAIRRREQPQTSRSMLPVLQSSLQTSILQLAWKRQIPVWEVHRMNDPGTINVLIGYQPDVICVACFSKRIPRAILDIPRFGCLNVHPSLLPANRAGPILAREVVDVPDGISYSQLEAQCAELGGRLLARSAWNLYKGVAVPAIQDETKSSYHGFPSDDDFVVPVLKWSARHVYNFICGVASWGTPLTLRVGNRSMFVEKAISYSHKNMDYGNSDVDSQPSEGFWVRCKQGSVRVK